MGHPYPLNTRVEAQYRKVTPFAPVIYTRKKRTQRDDQRGDLTIAIGTRFQVGVGGNGANLRRPAKLLDKGIDADMINRVYGAEKSLVADARSVLQAIT